VYLKKYPNSRTDNNDSKHNEYENIILQTFGGKEVDMNKQRTKVTAMFLPSITIQKAK
jgi:hypothetical protein